MKLVITNIIILFCTILNAQNNETKLEENLREREYKDSVGLCTIETSTNINPNTDKFYLLKISETELRLTIKIDNLTIDEQIFFFGKEIKTIPETEKFFFTQNYDFELNPETIQLLQLKTKKPTIKNGIYPIQFIDKKAIIQLKLFSKN